MSPNSLLAAIAPLLLICLGLQWLLATERLSPWRLSALGAVNIVYAIALAALMVSTIVVLGSRDLELGWLLGLKLTLLALVALTSVPTARAFLQWRALNRDVPGLMPRPWQVRRLRRWVLLRIALYMPVPVLGLLMARLGD